MNDKQAEFRAAVITQVQLGLAMARASGIVVGRPSKILIVTEAGREKLG